MDSPMFRMPRWGGPWSKWLQKDGKHMVAGSTSRIRDRSSKFILKSLRSGTEPYLKSGKLNADSKERTSFGGKVRKFSSRQLLATHQTSNRTEIRAEENALPGIGAKRGRMLKREKLALGSERISTTLSTLVLKT